MNEANTPAVEVQDEQTPLEHLIEVHELVHDKSATDGGLVEYNQGFRNGVERSLSIMQSRDPNYERGPDEHATARSAEAVRNVTQLRDMQGEDPAVETNEYLKGLYNGLELALANIEGRDPEYK